MPHNNFPMLFGPRRVFKACCAYCRSHSISINLNRANVLWVPRMGTKCTVYPTRFVYTLPIIDSKTETIFVLTWECEQTWLADLRTNMTYEHCVFEYAPIADTYDTKADIHECMNIECWNRWDSGRCDRFRRSDCVKKTFLRHNVMPCTRMWELIESMERKSASIENV